MRNDSTGGISKKAKSSNRASTAGRRAVPKTVDEYLAGTPEPARSTLQKLRAAIRGAAPREATEAISYGIPAFRHNGVLVWFAAFAKHCSLFPTASVIEKFKSELKDYTISKGTIQFPTDKPLPAALVKKIVKARIEEMKAKKRH
ncbi:MAG TPA: DUF1801 domain-containing protein [Terriglobales bacterium]|nr:DUF1801 domain-containing protein [Terriglobales bacterium]